MDNCQPMLMRGLLLVHVNHEMQQISLEVLDVFLTTVARMQPLPCYFDASSINVLRTDSRITAINCLYDKWKKSSTIVRPRRTRLPAVRNQSENYPAAKTLNDVRLFPSLGGRAR